MGNLFNYPTRARSDHLAPASSRMITTLSAFITKLPSFIYQISKLPFFFPVQEPSANLAMATICSLQFPKPFALRNAKQTSSTSFPHTHANPQSPLSKAGQSLTLETPGSCVFSNSTAISSLVGAGFALTLVGPAFAADLPLVGSTLGLNEPVNALSLPTWAVHVSSVAEW